MSILSAIRFAFRHPSSPLSDAELDRFEREMDRKVVLRFSSGSIRLQRGEYVVFLFVYLLVVLPSYAQNGNFSISSQAAIIQGLESSNAREAEHALYDLLDQVEYDQLKYIVSPQIKSALRTALRNDIERRDGINMDKTLEPTSEEYTRVLAETLIAIQDREAIPLLIEIAPMGNIIQYGLLDSGSSLVPFLVEYSESNSLTDRQASGVLSMFSASLKEWGDFDPDTHNKVKNITMKYLDIPSDYTYPQDDPESAYLYAMFLASDLGDEDLKEMVIDIVPIEQRFSDRMGLSHMNWAKYVLENWNRSRH